MKPAAKAQNAASLLAGALILCAACRRADPASSAATPSASPPTVSVGKARKGPISRTIALPATVRPHEQAVLYAKVAGYLKTIRVDKGDWGHEGALLPEIASPALAAAMTPQNA